MRIESEPQYTKCQTYHILWDNHFEIEIFILSIVQFFYFHSILGDEFDNITFVQSEKDKSHGNIEILSSENQNKEIANTYAIEKLKAGQGLVLKSHKSELRRSEMFVAYENKSPCNIFIIFPLNFDWMSIKRWKSIRCSGYLISLINRSRLGNKNTLFSLPKVNKKSKNFWKCVNNEQQKVWVLSFHSISTSAQIRTLKA